MTNSVSKHAASHHNCKFEEFTITPIEQISPNSRNKTDLLCKREMFWIFQLHTLIPYGLNETLEKYFNIYIYISFKSIYMYIFYNYPIVLSITYIVYS